MKMGKNIGDTMLSAFDDIINRLHNDKTTLISEDCEDYCDNILYDNVADTLDEFDSSLLIFIINRRGNFF